MHNRPKNAPGFTSPAQKPLNQVREGIDLAAVIMDVIRILGGLATITKGRYRAKYNKLSEFLQRQLE